MRSRAALISSSVTRSANLFLPNLAALIAGVVLRDVGQLGAVPAQLHVHAHVVHAAVDVPRRGVLVARLVLVGAVVAFLLLQLLRGIRSRELLRLAQRDLRHAVLGELEMIRAEEIAS